MVELVGFWYFCRHIVYISSEHKRIYSYFCISMFVCAHALWFYVCNFVRVCVVNFLTALQNCSQYSYSYNFSAKWNSQMRQSQTSNGYWGLPSSNIIKITDDILISHISVSSSVSSALYPQWCGYSFMLILWIMASLKSFIAKVGLKGIWLSENI